MKTFLFQGDSITDFGRSRDNDNNLGIGYPLLFSADYLKSYPNEYKFLNRGISGNRVVDVYARIKIDILNLKPDYMSILIGVNDVWHELGCGNGVAAPKYEKVFSMLIEEIKEALPDIKIFILEPFVLSASATSEHYDYFRPEVELRAAAAKRVAEKYDLIFVPLQQKFDDAVKIAPAEYWLSDGVHPAPAGHQLIKEALAEAFDTVA